MNDRSLAKAVTVVFLAAVVLGGALALCIIFGQLSELDPRYRGHAHAVLTAFVRRHAPRPPTVPESEVAMDRRRAGWGWGQRGKVDPMFAAENLRDWRGHTVIDPEGHKIGTLEAVYVDTASDEPCFLSVKVGMMNRHRLVFVPVAGVTVSPKAVRVQYPKKLVHDAPAIDTDGELAATAEPEVFAYYNLDYGSRSERRLARR